jgi:hypothetical protein
LLKDKFERLRKKLIAIKINKNNSLPKNRDNSKLTCSSNTNSLLKSPWGVLAIIIIFSVFIWAALTPYHVSSTNDSSPAIEVTKVVLGNSSIGTVIKEGPYGNPNSSVRIAYVLGLHPRESRAHNATIKIIKENSKSLKYGYYLYYINVTQDTYDYYAGRSNGQNLAYKYIVPNINQSNFNLVIDVHASNGRYIDKPFVFVPLKNNASLNITKKLTTRLKWLYYYSFPDSSSPSYCTIPIIKGGTPAIIYEVYAQPNDTINQQVKEFVLAIDNLNL